MPNQAELAVGRLMHGAALALDTARASVAGAAEALGGNPVAFVQRRAPHAKAAAAALGVSLRTVLAHAALETGWGSHVPATADGQPSFNLFGIKAGASWSGARVVKPTLEFEHGVAVRRAEAFRAYDNPADGFADYRSEEHTSELQSLMRISYAVFCLQKKKQHKHTQYINRQTATN